MRGIIADSLLRMSSDLDGPSRTLGKEISDRQVMPVALAAELTTG